MNITEIREALAQSLSEFGSVQVWLAPTEYGKSFGPPEEANFSIKIITGSAEDGDAVDAVDDLFEDVPAKLAEETDLGGLCSDVSPVSCSGQRMYGVPDKEPSIGAEWRVLVVSN